MRLGSWCQLAALPLSLELLTCAIDFPLSDSDGGSQAQWLPTASLFLSRNSQVTEVHSLMRVVATENQRDHFDLLGKGALRLLWIPPTSCIEGRKLVGPIGPLRA